MIIWPETLEPLMGCRILFHEDTDKPYAMPIRSLTSICEEGVKDHNDSQAWHEFAYHNDLLSKSETVACFQRAVILDSHNPGRWYILACHYELEGTDWYGATNAFNPVIFLEPKNAAAWYSLASLWSNKGLPRKAQECYERFKKLQPTYE
jgi:tetratricopeptide (TPR) repeat protein